MRLLDVVGDERLQRVVAVLLEASLDEVRAATARGRDVRDAHDAVDALTVDHALAGGHDVSSELDPLADLADGIAVAPGFDDGRRRHDRWLQVAVLPRPAISHGCTIATSP